MELYKNLEAGVRKFEFDSSSITIEFTDGSAYVYNSRKPGYQHVRNMQILAKKGYGLTTYINKYVRENYALKIK